MSFSSEQKKIIIENIPKNSCCKHSFVDGVIFAKGVENNSKISVTLESVDYSSFFARLIKEITGKDALILSSLQGGRCKNVVFQSSSLSKYISGLENAASPLRCKCKSCKASFLRGVFFASGRISDPEKQYRLEFSVKYRAEIFNELFKQQQINLKNTQQKGTAVLYTNSSTVIQDFFALCEMNETVFNFINTSIKGEIKNNANRVTNCETNNIDKTVMASGRQIEAIKDLYDANLISSLPEDLEITAKIRLQFPDYSLTRLRGEFTTPISRSGLSHRLQRLVEIAEKKLGKKYR